MAKNEVTSKEIASIAAKLLRNPNTPPDIRSLAASALTQRPDRIRR